jgi:nucleotide-binding universal stress UspA family protein
MTTALTSHSIPKAHAFHSIPKKILLPIDFSSSTKAAVRMAADLAHHFHAELHIVNVIPFFPTTTLPNFVPEEKFLEDARADAEQHLEKYIKSPAVDGVKVTANIETGNDVVGKIIATIERDDIDLLVISTHGISGWHPLIFGSIAEKLIKLAQCPLLLLRSDKEAT